MFNNSTAAFSNRTRGSQQLKTVIWNMGFQIFFPDQGNISFQIKEIFLSRSRKYSSPVQENITFQIKGIFFSRSRKYFFPDQGHIKIKLNEAWAASPPPLAAGDGSTSDEIWLNWISNCHPSLRTSVKAMEWLYFRIVVLFVVRCVSKLKMNYSWKQKFCSISKQRWGCFWKKFK